MKLFRKSRSKLIKNEGVFKYLIYAFGEILLVVLGILIAVYLNNWNEERKEAKELENILSIIKDDLENDIKEAKEVIQFEEGKNNLYQRFFDEDLIAKDYKENIRYRRLIFGFKEISFNKRGFELLNNYKNSLEISNDALITLILELYSDALRNLDFEINYKYWKNQDWWSNYIREEIDDKFIDYALTSQDYKNRVASWHFITFKAFIPELEDFIKEAEKIHSLIENRK